MGEQHAPGAAGWQFVFGGVVLAGWAWVVEGVPVVSWTPRFVAALGFLALVGTAVTYLIWFIELHRASLVTLSAWTMLTPGLLARKERNESWLMT